MQEIEKPAETAANIQAPIAHNAVDQSNARKVAELEQLIASSPPPGSKPEKRDDRK